MGACQRKYFISTSGFGFRFNSLSFDTSFSPDPWPIVCPYPFMPLAWMAGDGTGRIIGLPPAATQNGYFTTLEALISQMNQANGLFPIPSIDNCTYSGDYANYTLNYYGSNVTPPPAPFAWGNPIGLFNTNWNSGTFPLGMLDQFWQDETTTPVPSTLYQRLYAIAKTLQDNSDLRLWTPPGTYTIPETFGPLGHTLANAAADPNLGNGEGLAFLALELKPIM